MKTLSVVLALLGFASPVRAGIDLTWKNCVVADVGEPAPTVDQVFDCTTSQSYKLYGCFKTPIDLPNFYWLDFSIDFYWMVSGREHAKNLQPFWHFEDGGCNRSGIALSIDKSQSGDANGGCGRFVTPWGENGNAATAYFGGYGPDFNGNLGRGRLLGSIVRPADDPFPLHPGVNYYGFEITLNTDHREDCEGCTDTMYVPVVHVVLLSAPSGEPYAVLMSSDKGTTGYPFVTINAEGLPTPVVNTTWGQIKSQYR